MGGLDGPPKPPALGDAPGKPWRPSGLLRGFGGLDGPPKPPALGDAPAKPWRPSGLLRGFGGLDGALLWIASRFWAADTAPHTGPRSDAARQSLGAPRSGGAIAGGPERAPATAQQGSSRRGGAVALSVILSARTGLLEDGLELELAADRPVGLHGLESRHRVVVDVTVLVEAPLAVDALEVLGGRDRLAHGLALLGDVLRLLDLRRGPADRVDDDPASLGRVQGVRGRLLAVLRLVGLVRLGADAPHLLEGQSGEGDPHVGSERRVARGALEQLFFEKPVRSHETRPRRDETHFLHLPDDDLRAGLDDAAHVDEIRAGGPDLREDRLLVGLFPVDAFVGDHGQPDLLRGGLEDVGDALAVEFLVVEDEHLLDAQALGPLGGDGALDVVGRDRPEVVHEPARPVDLRLTRRGAALLRQPGIRVGRRHLRHVRAVGDRDRDLGGARVVGADVDDRERVTDRLVRVLGLDRAVPLAGLRRGIVEIHDLQAEARDHAADLRDREFHAVLHPRTFREHRALHRPRRVEAKLTLGALLGIGGGGEPDEAEEQSDGGGHAKHSHGWTSLIGAIMLPSDPAGRYQTMFDQDLSTLARLPRANATVEPA